MKITMIPLLTIIAVFSLAPGVWAQEEALPAGAGEVAAEEAMPAPVASPGGAVVEGDKPKIYVVKKGDTLWDISQIFYGDPYTWPKLWQQNPDITNPHLIYPGDRVMLTEAGELVILPRTMPEAPVSAPVALEEPAPPEKVVKQPVKKYMNNDKYIAFIQKEKLEGMGYVVRDKFGEKEVYSENDSIIMKVCDADKYKEKDLLNILQKGDLIKHPVSNEKLGYIVRYVAIVRITGFQGKDLVEGLVIRSFYEFRQGDRVTEYTEMPGEITITKGPEGLVGHIIVSKDQLTAISSERLVLIDVGEQEGVKVGNVFEILGPKEDVRDRDVSKIHLPWNNDLKDFNDMPKAKDKMAWIELEQNVLGELVVLRVMENMSAGEITKSIRSLKPGSEVRVKPEAEKVAAQSQ